jgi:hypothetical protein
MVVFPGVDQFVPFLGGVMVEVGFSGVGINGLCCQMKDSPSESELGP